MMKFSLILMLMNEGSAAGIVSMTRSPTQKSNMKIEMIKVRRQAA